MRLIDEDLPVGDGGDREGAMHEGAREPKAHPSDRSPNQRVLSGGGGPEVRESRRGEPPVVVRSENRHAAKVAAPSDRCTLPINGISKPKGAAAV